MEGKRTNMVSDVIYLDFKKLLTLLSILSYLPNCLYSYLLYLSMLMILNAWGIKVYSLNTTELNFLQKDLDNLFQWGVTSDL